MRKIGIYMLAGLLLLCMGCNDWLDVRPKSQVKESDLFESESGFRDALTGIYVLMGRSESYGGQRTMGLMDMVAQTYTEVPYELEGIVSYNYQLDEVKALIDTLWSTSYNAIANCNYLLRNIEEHGDVMSDNLRDLVQGEALALRAFLHFDLLRGFAPSYKMGKDDLAIPYMREVTNAPVAQSTVSKVLDYILEDLTTAKKLLEPIDPIGPAFADYSELPEDDYEPDDYITDDGFWLYRTSRMNYYGVVACMARVYLYKEDMQNALESALEVINSERFEFISDAIRAEESYDFEYMESVARHEYISSLYVYDLLEGRSDMFFKELATYECTLDDGRKSLIFTDLGINLDIRSKNMFGPRDAGGGEFVNKYMTGTQIPLIKLSEMYLIAAEASGDINYLETLRANRGYGSNPLPAGADLQEEIQNEYRKEFIAEGQLFYYYKRQNLASIPFAAQTMNRDTYVFPVPDNELEFGNFK